ncbi:MAG TPA: DHA2 family efflux MFS transporter permease subunit [Acidimicrobiia bacterium]|nr:DHA2 family efflux MFS transporter permease subunit [Acidimicrobiia bacterium]
MSVVLTGTFMVILDSTIVNVALPVMGRELGSAEGIEWVVTGYLLAVGVAQLGTGWVSDQLGKKRVYTWSLFLFGLGSLAASLAPNLGTLIGFRVLQGLGGGAMMPVGLAMLYELFPPQKRGTALGIWGIAAMAAPAVGPVVGGWIASSVSWRWVFAVNVPVGGVGVVLATHLLRDVGYRERRALEWRNWLIAATGLVALLLAFDSVSNTGWAAPSFLALSIAGLALLTFFVRREFRSEYPLLEMGMFKVPTFSLTIAVVWLITVAQFARLVFIPIELQTVHGLTALETGLLLAPAAGGTALTMPFGGRIADRFGARIPVTVGLAMISTASWLLGSITPDTFPGRILAYLLLQGAGTGLALIPNTVAAMNSIPNRWVARGSAIRSLNRQVAGAVGVGVLASLVVARVGSITGNPTTDPLTLQAAYNLVFHVAFVGALAATVLALFLPGRHQTREVQDRLSAEYRQLDLG